MLSRSTNSSMISLCAISKFRKSSRIRHCKYLRSYEGLTSIFVVCLFLLDVSPNRIDPLFLRAELASGSVPSNDERLPATVSDSFESGTKGYGHISGRM